MVSYEPFSDYELPSDMRLSDLNDPIDPRFRENFVAAITPCIFLTGISQGKTIKPSFEFYRPMSAARQFGLGQLPIGLFFIRSVKAKDIVP